MKDQLKKISDVLWELPQSTRPDMRVPARFYLSEDMLGNLFRDRSVDQLLNVATLPGIQSHALVMPDVHEGYGFPIGGVAAMDAVSGVVSPGGIGYDINCGIRLLKTEFVFDDIKGQVEKLSKEIFKTVPSGVGRGGVIKLAAREMDKVLNQGCAWALNEGYATDEDIRHIESFGSLMSADAHFVSNEAKARGADQIGTMGAGNHFVEIDRVGQILDQEAAAAYGLFTGQIVIQIHCGSRGLGHQVATDYIRQMVNSAKDFDYRLPDRELSCAPIDSAIGKNYLSAMSAAANFAWANRQLISWEIRQAWRNVFRNSGGEITLMYDVAHNIAKMEEHTVNGKKKKVLVHRKGSTRAFPAGHPEVPPDYRAVGQPVLIPGSMGTASYVLAGQPGSMEQSFGSSCHGSGRLMSRSAAKKRIEGSTLRDQLEDRGIIIQTGSVKGLAEEAPDAYKDVESVVDVVGRAGIAKKVARLKPVAVIKG